MKTITVISRAPRELCASVNSVCVCVIGLCELVRKKIKNTHALACTSNLIWFPSFSCGYHLQLTNIQQIAEILQQV